MAKSKKTAKSFSITESPDRGRLVSSYVRNTLAARFNFLSRLMDDPRKDVNAECGYPDNPTIDTYRTWYDREGIATRIVNVYPDECWSIYPEIYEREGTRSTPFERGWQDLLDTPDCNPLSYLHRADCLSGIGCYGVMMIGIDDGKDLSEPVDGIDENGQPTDGRRERKLLYLRVFDESLIQVLEYNGDVSSPRYCRPRVYGIQLADPNLLARSSSRGGQFTSSTPPQKMTSVHWTRVIHFADNRMSSEVFGVSRLQNVLNRLFDLRKILSGSGEMFWRGAMPGWAFETPPELGTEVDRDDTALRDQVEAWQNGLQKYIALTGMRARSLAPQVSEPTAHVEEQLRAICTTIKVPMRVFLGSEAAHLASMQDKSTWNGRLGHRQLMYLNPYAIRPTIDRFGMMGLLPRPKSVNVFWNDLNTVSDEMKADVALKRSQAMFQYVSGKCESMMPLREYFVVVMGMTPAEADEVIRATLANKSLITKKSWDQPATGPQGGGKTGNAGKKPGRKPGNPGK